MESDRFEGLDERGFQLVVHAAKQGIGFRARHGWPVCAMLDQGGENIRYRQDPNEVRDAAAGEPVRIAGAVEVFVVVPDGIENFR